MFFSTEVSDGELLHRAKTHYCITVNNITVFIRLVCVRY